MLLHADAQADESLRWAHRSFVGFVVHGLNFNPHPFVLQSIFLGIVR